jgi:hypothetical protein
MQSTAKFYLVDDDPSDLHGILVARDIARITLIFAVAAGTLMISDIKIGSTLEGWSDWLLAIAVCSFSLLAFQCGRLTVRREPCRAHCRQSRCHLALRWRTLGILAGNFHCRLWSGIGGTNSA